MNFITASVSAWLPAGASQAANAGDVVMESTSCVLECLRVMSPSAKAKPPIKERLQELMAEYGSIALIVFFSLFVLTYMGFYLAIEAGVDVGDSTAGATGTYVAAWLATKLTMPLRIGATLLLTPLVAFVWHKIRRTSPKTRKPTEEA